MCKENKPLCPQEAEAILLRTNDRENQDSAPHKRSCEDSGESGSGPDNFGYKSTVDQTLDLAFSHYNFGRLSEAEQLCRLVLARVPEQIDAMQLLGTLLNETGQYAEAVQLLRKAIRQAPRHAHLHNNLGIALHRMDNSDEAVLEFSKALEIRPDFAKAHSNLGAALTKMGRLDEAVIACTEAIRLQPDFKEAHNNLGLALKKKGDLESAVASFRKAIDLDSEYAEALSNLGMVLIAQGRLKEAEQNLQRAVSLVPNSAEFRNNLGVVFNRQGRFQEAVDACEKAIAIRPDYVEGHNNLGTALMELGRFAEANAAFERAIGIDPECAEAHHNRSLILLLTGHFEQGWKEYEWRWKHGGFSTPLRPFCQQWWNGDVEGVARLLVWAEQGIGDEVQFSGLIRHIISRGISVVIECDRRLVPLLQRSFASAAVAERTDPPRLLFAQSNPSITHQIPMASIPRVLGLSPNSMPFQSPFMIPDRKRRDRFRSEYKADRNPVLIGISFKSGNSQEGLKRSIPLEYWGPILKIAGARFVNLQYGECSGQLRTASDRFGVEILQDSSVNPLTDLETFAAQVAAMDLVVSVDNSTVHFAGALGVEVWTMLPTTPDWRWGLEGDSTRWYPSMRLLRQEQRGKWEPVISKVAEELASFVSSTALGGRPVYISTLKDPLL